MGRLSALLLCTTLASPLQAAGAISDLFCDDSTRLEHQLLSVHGATKLGRGMRGPDALLEIWITPNNGDWTLVQSYANGTSCIVAIGENWEDTITRQDPA